MFRGRLCETAQGAKPDRERERVELTLTFWKQCHKQGQNICFPLFFYEVLGTLDVTTCHFRLVRLVYIYIYIFGLAPNEDAIEPWAEIYKHEETQCDS